MTTVHNVLAAFPAARLLVSDNAPGRHRSNDSCHQPGPASTNHQPEDIPLPDGQVDVVISNCVINLSADKPRVLAEAFRVLRPGGRLGISDVTTDEDIDPSQLAQAEQRAGCISGTLTRPQYHDLLLAAGFTAITITSTHQAGAGLHSAIIQAAKPTARNP